MARFNEKKTEFDPKENREIPVWFSPKYEESKKKAIEVIDSGSYGLLDSDFWILMKKTKSGKMGYTGLIISHNGCLKINDKLDKKFDPNCVSVDKEGFCLDGSKSLVYTYCNAEQGIYEVGEVSKSNCKQDYPYAMAYKRLFDRVVLKLSKIAYSGIYSETEAEEFKNRNDTPEEELKDKKVSPINTFRCNNSRCNAVISKAQADRTRDVFAKGKVYCADCEKKLLEKLEEKAKTDEKYALRLEEYKKGEWKIISNE